MKENVPPALADVIDAREATRARQPGRADLREVVVTVTQTATGRRQAVRLAAPDARAARALAMTHATILDGAPRDLSPASLALRHLDFGIRPDDGAAESPRSTFPSAPAPERVVPVQRATGADGQAAYSVVIATDPLYWTEADGTEPSAPEARLRAERLATAARAAFPGLRCDLVAGPVEKLDLSEGPDPVVRERLEAWVDARMKEMLGVMAARVTTDGEERKELDSLTERYNKIVGWRNGFAATRYGRLGVFADLPTQAPKVRPLLVATLKAGSPLPAGYVKIRATRQVDRWRWEPLDADADAAEKAEGRGVRRVQQHSWPRSNPVSEGQPQTGL